MMNRGRPSGLWATGLMHVVASGAVVVAVAGCGGGDTSGTSPAAAQVSCDTATAWDLEGEAVRPLAKLDGPAVLIFARTDCPNSNRYAPLVRRLHEKFSGQGVAFWLVYPEPSDTAELVAKHAEEYAYNTPALRDAEHQLVGLAGATVTPEAAIVDRHGKVVYLGGIDSRFVDLGREKKAAVPCELEQALDALVAGRPLDVTPPKAVGCYISRPASR